MGQVHRIHQDRDEGQNGDLKTLQLADVRGAIYAMISISNTVSWSKANAMGKEMTPTMAATTIINFATGKTKQPSTWTVRMLTDQVGYKPVLLPKGMKLPKGAVELK